ncbi:hypothetical protein [Hymenobacter cellulosivorans]|uniref:Uncharacterized protein n=1 Tax=Hymenobacter cellulosivorans TaxID=2932249 RepID=A0ABY4F308_9BACT|nr:hypothetical protein [Hymenobacter cellulosivorans]UOQ50869.1 hypothetical protein MUN80_13985 [Hymenobacter cellulosivorans]
MRSISSDDAKLIVKAWGKFGPAGLRALSSISKVPERALRLIDAVWDEAKEQGGLPWIKQYDGSFFGGLLAVRFGDNGLRSHVLEFLKRLDGIAIEDSTNSSTLLDALLYIAACHGTNVSGLDGRVLADLVGVPRDWVQSRVVRPLGAEAGTVDSGGHVFTRHSRVAAAIIVEAENSLSRDFAEVWSRLVRQTAEAGRDVYYDSRSYGVILNAGPRILTGLPSELAENRRESIAIAAARAAMEYDQERLIPITTLGKTYRLAKEYEQAISLFREKYKYISDKMDYISHVRSFFHEWSISESEESTDREKVLNGAALLGFSISDSLNPSSITDDDIKMVCSSLASTFIKLARVKGSVIDAYAKGTRSASYLAYNVGVDKEGLAYYERHERISNEIGVPTPVDYREAIDWLHSGIREVGLEVKSSVVIDITKPLELSFLHLSTVVGTCLST